MTSQTLRFLLPIALVTLAACGKAAAPLAPELKEVRCPPGEEAHAAGQFAKARVTFLCLPPKLAEQPHLLRCDLESMPRICEDAGSLLYARTPSGLVRTGLPKPGGADDGEGGSRLTVNFRAGPPKQSTFEPVETDWRFLTDEGERLLPPGFKFVKGTLCDRRATVLGTGTCNLEAQSDSLYWHIAVSLRYEPGTEITPAEYAEALSFWLKHLGRLVQDPAPAK
jgi:hypothetical protein